MSDAELEQRVLDAIITCHGTNWFSMYKQSKLIKTMTNLSMNRLIKIYNKMSGDGRLYKENHWICVNRVYTLL